MVTSASFPRLLQRVKVCTSRGHCTAGSKAPPHTACMKEKCTSRTHVQPQKEKETTTLAVTATVSDSTAATKTIARCSSLSEAAAACEPTAGEGTMRAPHSHKHYPGRAPERSKEPHCPLHLPPPFSQTSQPTLHPNRLLRQGGTVQSASAPLPPPHLQRPSHSPRPPPPPPHLIPYPLPLPCNRHPAGHAAIDTLLVTPS